MTDAITQPVRFPVARFYTPQFNHDGWAYTIKDKFSKAGKKAKWPKQGKPVEGKVTDVSFANNDFKTFAPITLPNNQVPLGKPISFVKPGEVIEETYLKDKLNELLTTYRQAAGTQVKALKMISKLKKQFKKMKKNKNKLNKKKKGKKAKKGRKGKKGKKSRKGKKGKKDKIEGEHKQEDLLS